MYNNNILIYYMTYNLTHNNILCIMCNVFAWTRVATSEHPVEVDPTDLIIEFKMMLITNILTMMTTRLLVMMMTTTKTITTTHPLTRTVVDDNDNDRRDDDNNAPSDPDTFAKSASSHPQLRSQ